MKPWNNKALRLWGKRIFSVEDNASNVGVIATLLQLDGATVSFERFGTTWLQSLRRFKPVDLILLDLMLPNNLSGYDLFEQIRSHKEFDAVPIVIVSASDSDTEIPKSKALGLNGFISKPLNADFPAMLASIIDGDEVWGDMN